MIYSTRKDLSDSVISEYNRTVKGQIEQLYTCKAWIFMPDNSDFIILRSYSTIVAAYQFSTGILWVFGYYSATTSSHIAKFWNWIAYEYQDGLYYPRKVNLYNDSRTGKRAARKNLDDDFASVISTALNQH
jgi:hypothetical protein